MPTDEDFLQKAEEFKAVGNEAFQNGDTAAALAAYSQGVASCDRIVGRPEGSAALKATLLSNRAMCRLKIMQLPECIEDCTAALDLQPSEAKLRYKLWFRRAKARFLLVNLPHTPPTVVSEGLQEAAKDLLQLLSADPKNSEAQQLLTTVRAQHKQTQLTANTPISKTLDALRDASDDANRLHQVKIMLGLLDNDPQNATMELGRLKGVDLLFQVANITTEDKVAHLALQCLSQAGSNPMFVRSFLVDKQKDICAIVQKADLPETVMVAALAVYVRIVLHADRDDPHRNIDGKSSLDYTTLLQTLRSALVLHVNNAVVIRAVLDLINTWTAGTDRETLVRHSLHQQVNDPLLPLPKTQSEIRAFTPQELAVHRKRESDKKTRDEAWAFERSKILLTGEMASILLNATCSVTDHVVRREMTVMIGRLLSNLQDDDEIKGIVKPLLQEEGSANAGATGSGPIIEEVNEDDDEETKQPAAADDKSALETMMRRAIIVSALLLSKKEIGAWALGSGGWVDSADELEGLIESGDPRAMCLASEVVSAAATVETARELVANLTSSKAMEVLLMSDDRDIRSGAASAVAKLGLSNRDTQTDEGEVMGMLQAACDLLEDEIEAGIKPSKDEAKFRHFNSFATSSVERAIEMINYLISSTIAKDELAAGFKPRPESTMTSLERLVKTADLPNAGESLSGFALATIFQNMAVTNLQVRREGFEGKEVTMEQYDEMQKLGKTEEEKEVMDSQTDPDTPAACSERIRKMASANVPRAMVALIEGASEHTLEQLVLGMNRMAGEPSVRGVMIQQGVLSACIKVEKNEGPTETDTMKKVIRLARHCIAKLLVTTNPSLLTSAQRLGSIRPLIQLIRDTKASDLQQFEALLSLTNIAGSGEDAQNRIVSERGISTLHFAMFSDHEMVRCAATEGLCNMVTHQAMIDHLSEEENMRLWLAFASDYEANYECARAAAGCLAMASQDESIASRIVASDKFRSEAEAMLESGRLELMHRAFVLILNLVTHGGNCREKVVQDGLVDFCEAYVKNYSEGGSNELDFPEAEKDLLPVTLELASKIVRVSG